jgi:hypothetical protein
VESSGLRKKDIPTINNHVGMKRKAEKEKVHLIPLKSVCDGER